MVMGVFMAVRVSMVVNGTTAYARFDAGIVFLLVMKLQEIYPIVTTIGRSNDRMDMKFSRQSIG